MPFARDKLGAQRELVRSEAHRFHSIHPRDAFHLEQDAARLDHGNPVIGSAFAYTHTRFGGLLRDRLIGKHPDPDLAAPLDETRDGDTAGLNLPVGDVTRLQCLDSKIAERELAPGPGFAGHAPALLLAVLHFLGHQHNEVSNSRLCSEFCSAFPSSLQTNFRTRQSELPPVAIASSPAARFLRGKSKP